MNDQIYSVLAEHQTTSDWQQSDEEVQRLLRRTFEELHHWANLFIFEFKLEIPEVSLGIQKLRRNTLGHFRGCNGFGLKHEIMLDQAHVFDGSQYELLATLLHELLHGWQYLYGKPGKRNYHNRNFQRKAADYGLYVDAKGRQQIYPAPTPFSELLDKHGVSFPELPEIEHITKETERIQADTAKPDRANTSKLKLWLCNGGQKARVGRAEFSARCTICNTEFEKVLH